MESTVKTQIDPSRIMQVGMGFWASKTLLTAINMELFTLLGEKELSGEEIQDQLKIHDRNLYDFLDTLVALGFLERVGLKESALYCNAEDTRLFLDKNKSSYVGGMLEMANNRLYPFWSNLEEALKTGKPQNETKSGGLPVFEALYSDPARLREFLKAMGGIQMGNFMALSRCFDFSEYRTLCDLGGAGGELSIQVVRENPHMSCISYDLPPVEPIVAENISRMGLGEQISVRSGDFFKDEIPAADVITMGNVLHDWGLEDKKRLIRKAWNALPAGGALIVIENIIDDERSQNVFGLLMSLNMMIETPEGFDFSFSDFNQWVLEAGFRETWITPLTGPASAAVAIK